MSVFRPHLPLGSRRRVQPLAQIQITPLIDVLLVLLVLGVLLWARGRPLQGAAARVPAQPPGLNAMALALPGQSTPLPGAVAPDEHEALIGLGAHGQLSWQGRPVTRDLLMHQVQGALAHDPDARIWLAIDAATPYAEVIHWLDWLQARQVSQVNLLTAHPVPGSPAPEASRKP